MKEQLLTPDEVADRLRISVGTLANWRVSGSGPLYIEVTPRCIRYRMADVQAFEDSKQKEFTRDIPSR